MQDYVTLMNIFRLFQHYRQEFGYAFAAATMCALRHIQLRHDWRETCTSAAMCALFAFGVDAALGFFGLSGGKAAWMVACFIGYIGIDTVMKRIDGKLNPGIK